MENTNSEQQQINKTKKQRKRYPLLTFVLILCIAELVVSNFRNISKDINFTGKIRGLQEKKNEEMDRNKQLKSEIENFNSETNLESIARNNLKMAGQNEILVIINKPQEQNPQEQPKQQQ